MARATKSAASHARAKRSPAATDASCAGAWTIRHTHQVSFLQSPALSRLPWLAHGFSLRPGGESALGSERVLNLGFTEWDQHAVVEANREKLAAALAASRTQEDWRWVTLHQIHSDVIHVINGNPQPAAQPKRKGDALVTSAPGLLLGIQTADCVPILLADSRNRAVAAIHAGWRGTLARIAVKALGRMRMEFDTQPRDVFAAVGPAIGRCCYEVGPDVAQAFAAQFPAAVQWFDGPFHQLAYGEEPLGLPWLTMMPPGHVPPPPRVLLDLRAANSWQLAQAGVPEKHIDVCDLCTACRADLLFSHRREQGKTGRMMAVIGVR